MRFKKWLLEAVMNPQEAATILGISDLSSLTQDELRKIYRTLSFQHHPDRNPGNPDSEDMMKKINGAYESLEQYLTKPAASNLFSTRAKSYNEADVQQWAEQVMSKFDRYAIHSVYQGYDLFGRIGWSPYGSKGKLVAFPPTADVNMFMASLKKIIPSFPATIVDLTIKDNEAWISWKLDEHGTKMQSISFERYKKKEKKAAGIGMKRNQVETYLSQHGLEYKGGASKYNYYGFPDQQSGEGYFIRLSAKTIRIVNRWRRYSSLEDKGVTTEEYYGNLTPAILDGLVQSLRKKTFKENVIREVAIQPSHVPYNVFMAIVRIWNSQATYEDWELLDKYPRRVALDMIRNVMEANGVKNIDEELKWWIKELSKEELN